jgi:glycosyltransferase 2 family protein
MTTATAQPVKKGIFGKGFIWKFIGLALSLGLAWYLLSQVDFNEFMEIARRVPLWSLVTVFIFYLLLNFFRSLRFRTLLERNDLPLRTLFPITLYHNFLVRTLPFKAGELSYVVLMRRYLNLSVGDGFISLVGSRLFELLLVALGCAIGLLGVTDRMADQGLPIELVALGGLVACIIALYFAGMLTRLAIRLWRLVAHIGPLSKVDLESKLSRMALQLDKMREPRLFLSTLLFSTCTYGLSSAFNLLLMSVIGVETSFTNMIAINSIAMLAAFFPISPGEVGIVESGWTFGLVTLAGVDMSTAASIGFFIHAIQLICALLSGILGYGLLQLSTPVTEQVMVGQEAG